MVDAIQSTGGLRNLAGASQFQLSTLAPQPVPPQAPAPPTTESGRTFLAIAELGGRATLAAALLSAEPESTTARIADSFSAARREPAAGQRELVQGVFGFRQETPDVVRSEGGDGRVLFEIAGTETGGNVNRVGEIIGAINFEAVTAARQDLTQSVPGSDVTVPLPFPETAIGAYTPNNPVNPQLWNLPS